MKYVYGPVLSRRLGQSLGVDPIPLKTCNWNCVYCQLGRSTPLTNQRKDYFPAQKIFKEIIDALKTYEPYQIDWITFSGSGEPLLCASIGWIIRELSQVTRIPIALITNGSLLYLQEVREAIMDADAVLPSINAGSAELYRRINRPHPEITFTKHVEGLVKFRNIYRGRLWIELMLIKGLNDTEEALKDIAAVLRNIRPDEVHINLPVRPPSETWIWPTEEDGLIRAMAVLGDVARVIRPINGALVLGHYETVIDAVLGIITRHPLREEELIRMLEHWTPWEVRAAIAELQESGKIQVVERYGKRFFCPALAHYHQ
jgi:wyosine [tRNA(Phe)-imidazoG37] synthetase (radical SAM superfamily)